MTRHILLCHGFMTDEHLWDAVRTDLERIGELTFVDQGQDADLVSMSKRALSDAPVTFDLIGFSFGGYVARTIYSLAPERVRTLVLMNTSARPDDTEARNRKDRLLQHAETRGFNGLSTTAIKRSLHPDHHAHETLISDIRRMAERCGAQTFINQTKVIRPDGRPALGAIACPTLVIWSEQDILRTKDEALELAHGIPHAKLHIFPNCGHMTPMERPKELAALLSDWYQ